MSTDRMLNQAEKKRLLEIARETVKRAAAGQGPAGNQPDLEGLEFQRGAFVTLHRHGQLRGCIGNFTSEGPLTQTIENMAVAASLHDPRFRPVSPQEVDDIDLEISVLTPLRPIEDVEEIQVGRHGIYIISPRGRGVLLPQVATEYGWDRYTFLDQTCVKAGLAPGCWKKPDTQILIFEAQIFSENDPG